ncbi:hypothetical protein F4V57_07505 [Acinetobacter qingfengensis]|uniref:Phage abortive infection protein n=1 Tax=Acinetobacter qingfengensis TaxID=1262585 RepID=A0A1E7R2U6_9GAMM|nr:hypothetical protein [Acinetobacter qingfengensis]KAA8733887.1 hypothetical protein F4V57_07505 [Acinetobacter qingfengensis]OEY93601.1 hypothetical protein BJI46_03930 [Acinetobacter qingfengensis]
MSNSTEKSIKKDFKISDYIGWILLGITLWFLFPWIFSFFFNWIMTDPKYYGENFGAVGDIYGSVNALFTSATLILVIVSTMMQRQANQDVREAMAKQLKQEQASSTAQLAQAIDSTKKQLELAIQVHEAQISESKYAIFNNKFYSLINFKSESVNNLVWYTDEHGVEQRIEPKIFFERLSKTVRHSLSVWSENPDEMDIEFLKKSVYIKTFPYSKRNDITSLLAYFSNYKYLIELVKNMDLSPIDKRMYLRIIANSMNYNEQIILFYISPLYKDLMECLKDSEIFVHFSGYRYEFFAHKFYNESYFGIEFWKEFFKEQGDPT